MKNKIWNKKIRTRLMAAGIAGALSLGLYGCGASAPYSSGSAGQEELSQEAGNDKSASGNGGAAAEAEDSRADGEQGAAEELGEADLYGEIQEVSGQTFVFSEAVVEASGEDDTEIVMLPLEEADMKLVTVSWDENTKFVQRAYSNGGDDYEDSESSPEALEAGAMAELWGEYEGEVFRASQIRLIV